MLTEAGRSIEDLPPNSSGNRITANSRPATYLPVLALATLQGDHHSSSVYKKRRTSSKRNPSSIVNSSGLRQGAALARQVWAGLRHLPNHEQGAESKRLITHNASSLDNDSAFGHSH